MIKKIVLILLISILLLSGCWDSREINDLGLVMVVGIDKEANAGNYIVTAQIARPSTQEKGMSGSDTEPVYTASAEGETIFDAIRNLAKFSSRRVMWAHNNIVIVGETLARDDITPVLDFFTRNMELRMRTWIAVSNGDAKPYVSTKTGMEAIPGMSLSSIFRYGELPAESVRTDVLAAYSDFLSNTIDPLLSGLKMEKRELSTEGGQEHGEKNQVELSGGAVFKGRRMVGWVSPEESRGLGFVKNTVHNSIIAVTFDENKARKLSIEVKDIHAKCISNTDGNIPSITIFVTGKGSIAEKDFSDINLTVEELKSKSELLVNDEIKTSIEKAVSKVQKEYKSDVLGFGRIIHAQHKSDWHEHIRANWRSIYPEIPVTVKTDIKVIGSTLYAKPLNADNTESEEIRNEE